MKNSKKAAFRFIAAGAAATALVAGCALGAAPANADSFMITMGTGNTLHSGDAIIANDVQYRLTMQNDGNLVEFGNGQVLWSSKTGGHPGASFTMQGDGNAVIYSSDGKPLWSTGTNVVGGTSGEVGLGMDGNLWVKHRNAVVWQNHAPHTNNMGGIEPTLIPGYYLHSGSAKLVMQADGNLVSYVNGMPVWSTRTAGQDVIARVTKQGALVMYGSTSDGDLRTVWSTPAAGAGAVLQLGMDGKLTLFSGSRIVWQS